MLATAMVSAAEMPVKVSDLVTGAPTHIRITNASSQPVTAWSLAAVTRTGDRTHREVYTTDGYLSEVTHGLPGSSERLERLMPGQSRELPLDPLPAGATVEVIAAVLDDGTAIGDRETIASIFAKRSKERDALKAIVDAFKDVLPATHGAEALTALRERFGALLRREDSVPSRAAMDAVQTFERKSSAAEIDQSLRAYAEFVTRQYNLAAKHAERQGLKN
jgi:hypothetical protein